MATAAGLAGGGGAAAAGPLRPAAAAAAAIADRPVGEEEASTEALMRDAENAFQQLFSVRPPRDALAGFWSGIWCVLSGLCLGVAGVILQPIEGMRENGVPGCFQGVVQGLCTGLFFSMTGLFTGVFQAVRGVVATPTAICMMQRGWRWDRAAGRWEEPQAYALPEEAAQLSLGSGGDDEDEGDGPGDERRRVLDTYYYDQLGVPPTASQQAIRRAYFQRSRQCHPDKVAEEGAKERFQMISEAYQVLSDPVRRREYDARGREGAGEGFVDAKVFFDVLLGADALAPYVGRLRLTELFGDLFSASSSADPNDNQPRNSLAQKTRDAERAEARQVRRQVRLALALAERLDGRGEAPPGDAAFRVGARAEAREILRKDPTLARFMTEIGWIYANRAEGHLARLGTRLGRYGPRALWLHWSSRGREAKQQATTAKLALRSFMQLRRIATHSENASTAGTGGTEDEMHTSVTDALPTFMDTFWSLTSNDIACTLDKVLERVLGDTSVGPRGQRARAEALQVLGMAFMAEAEEVKAQCAGVAMGSGSAAPASGGTAEDERCCKRFEEAFIASMGAAGAAQAPEAGGE